MTNWKTGILPATTMVLAMAGLPGPASAQEDPLEFFNRQMFDFNTLAVQSVIEPGAEFLGAWLPEPVQRAGGNVYSNVIEPEFIATNLMVGDYAAAGISAGRLVINSTLGIAGLFDPATGLGLVRREVEPSEALCVAGISPGPYLVLPLIGPTSANSAVLFGGAFAVEWALLSMVSTTLATANLIADFSVSAASLRYADDLPDMATDDPYRYQRAEYQQYLGHGCNTPGKAPAAGPA